jgi:intracellular sulfur oxidation DsrE/DsrF family protein
MLRAFALGLAALLAVSLTSAAEAAPDMARPGPAPAGYYVFQKVVYQNDSGAPDDAAYFARLMRHLSAHIEATGGNVEIRVVSFAAGLKLFVMAKTNVELAHQMDVLRAKGVRFLICRNSMIGMGLKVEDLYGAKPEDVVPSGVAEIARLEGMGFVYIHP